MERIFEIRRLSAGEYRCVVRDTDVEELSDAICGLCMTDEGEPLFDALMSAMVMLLSLWDASDSADFLDALGEASDSLRSALSELDRKRNTLN